MVGELEDAAIVVFADLRPIGLRQNHAHQIVRLRVLRRDTDGVACMVLGFCRHTKLEPHQVAVVGDNNHDLHMASSAGAGLKIGVLSGTGSPATLSELADVCLPDISELEALLYGVEA